MNAQHAGALTGAGSGDHAPGTSTSSSSPGGGPRSGSSSIEPPYSGSQGSIRSFIISEGRSSPPDSDTPIGAREAGSRASKRSDRPCCWGRRKQRRHAGAADIQLGRITAIAPDFHTKVPDVEGRSNDSVSSAPAEISLR